MLLSSHQSSILLWAGRYSESAILFFFLTTKMSFLNETMVLADGKFFLSELPWQKNGSNHIFVPRFYFEILVVHEIQKSN